MNRDQALIAIGGFQTTFTLRSGATEYVLYRSVTSFGALNSEFPYDVYFLRLENGVVTRRGLVGKREERRVRDVDSTFVLREWQAKDGPKSVKADEFVRRQP